MEETDILADDSNEYTACTADIVIVNVNLQGDPQKSKPKPNDQNCIKSHKSLSMRLDFLVKIKYESSTIILFVGTPIRYSMRDLLSDLI